VRTPWTVMTGVSCFIALAFSFSAPEPKRSENANGYPHGTATCLEGDNGPGVQLSLKQDSRCESKVSYPHLELDIRERPIHRNISIGSENWAFKCPSPKEGCEQALSGTIVFDHLEGNLENGTDGSYELRFSGGRSETGHFKVDCSAPCA
jgi:hypothetical protein